MYESDIQSAVSNAIMDGEVDRLGLGVTENENCVVVNIGNRDAAYTADEARHLADSIDQLAGREWESNPDDVVNYIRDLADVVDNDRTIEEIEERWEGKQLDITL